MDQDCLNRLEEKIRRTLQELDGLRKENRRLQEGTGEGAPSSDAEARLRLLQQERSTVRSRIEGLIAMMEERR